MAVLLFACTSSHEDGSTETGNPPALPEINSERVALVVSIDELHVVGESGAVMPGGIEVEVTTLGSGESRRGEVAADGSFDVAVDGTLNDTYELRAEDGGASSDPVYLVRGGAMVAEGEGGALSCQQRIDIASTLIQDAALNVDRSCEVDADCVLGNMAAVCHDACYPEIVSQIGKAELEAAVQAVEDGLCASFEADGCQIIAQPCVPRTTEPLACESGRCTQRMTSSCPTCLRQQLSWGMVGGFPPLADKYLLMCNTFTRAVSDGQSCSRELESCLPPGRGPALAPHAIDELQAMLDDPDVAAALASGQYYNRPPGPDEAYFTITIDGATINIGGECNAAAPCVEMPPGLAALKLVLDEIVQQQACTPEPMSMEPEPEPMPEPGGECPPNARFVEDVCLMCGLAGGCSMTEARCAVVCSENEHCAGSSLPICSPRGICEFYGCL